MTRLLHPAAVAAPATALLLAAATALVPAAAACAQALGVQAPPLATIFDAAPAGAEVVCVVPTLRGFSDRIAAFAAQTGLDGHGPDLMNALDAVKREMDMGPGLNDQGALLVVVSGLAVAMDAALDDDPANDHVEPSALFLVPVSDYAAFVSAMGGDPAADAAEVALGAGSGFARKVPGYAVIGETAQAVAAYAPGAAGQAMTQAVGPHSGPWFERGQTLVYIDVATLAPSLKSAVARGVAEIDHEMQGGAAAEVAMFAPVFTAYAGLLNGLIDGTDTLALTLDLGAEGLGVTAGGRLNADSMVSSMMRPAVADEANGGGSLLNRLPDQSYLFAGAADLARIDTTALTDAVRGVAADLKVAAGDGGLGGLPIQQMVDLYTEMLQVASGATAMGSVMYAPDAAAMMTGGFFKQLSITQTPDAQGVLARQEAVMEKMNGLTLPLPAMDGGGGPGAEMTFDTSYTQNALEIDGTRVDQFQVNTVLPPAVMQQFGPMAMVMGNAGTGGYLAAKDGYVLGTTVIDPQLVTQGLKALDANDGLGASATLAELRETQLPADAALEGWLSVRGLANTVNPFLMMFAAGGGQLNVPADLSPVALGAGGDPEGLVLRLFVPTDVVRFGMDTFDQFAPQAPAGGGGPARGRRAPRAL